ncbi:nose resistant to fluoxetine protein 6-like [Plodia interpunctella]|uniref:nose resistant to fluoxetine protein 6-like n=1 Tax=Plodia interpunctella TaxID=58824 RepID=UPI0023683413|nr:nose resistant to fluoxetine protein 6-like [Plodia interpunctella]
MGCLGNKVFGVVILLFLLKSCAGVIFRLNETQYESMPPLFALDPYEPCLRDPGGMYCLADFDLFSEEKSDLMRLIQEYSAHSLKHFNHTQIHRGICVRRACKQYLKTSNLTTDLGVILEACLNETVWKSYKLQTRLNKINYCDKTNETRTLDVSDMAMVVVYLVIIILNVGGSVYDAVISKKSGKGNSYLLAFSIRRNWAKLVEPAGAGPDPRLERFKIFYGIRTLTMICVFFSHTMLTMAFSYIDNPLYIEKSADDPTKQILFNGNLVTLTFFVMSGFLLAYNFQLHAEKYGVSWFQVPKGILLRWLRLTPTLALVLFTIATVMRHAGAGPLWKLVVSSEARACRTYWWAHLLYVNNYVYDDAYCMPATWYLAADTQLFCIGIVICFVARTPRTQKIILPGLLLVSMVIVAAHTYFQDLDPVVLQTPEKYRNLYETDDTFRLLYTRGHTNLSTYILGLAGGFYVYYLQREKKDWNKYKSYRWAFWLMIPMEIGVILSGGIFYTDEDHVSTPVKLLYATLYKPFFQLLVVIFIVGCVLKFENLYRSILEWRGFTWTGRVSYSAFLLHLIFQRGLVGIQLTPVHMSDYYAMVVLTATIALSFSSAALLWISVEGPINALTKAAFRPATSERRDNVQNV